MRRRSNVGLLLANRLRRWPNSKPTLDRRLMFAGYIQLTSMTSSLVILWSEGWDWVIVASKEGAWPSRCHEISVSSWQAHWILICSPSFTMKSSLGVISRWECPVCSESSSWSWWPSWSSWWSSSAKEQLEIVSESVRCRSISAKRQWPYINIKCYLNIYLCTMNHVYICVWV